MPNSQQQPSRKAISSATTSHNAISDPAVSRESFSSKAISVRAVSSPRHCRPPSLPSWILPRRVSPGWIQRLSSWSVLFAVACGSNDGADSGGSGAASAAGGEISTGSGAAAPGTGGTGGGRWPDSGGQASGGTMPSAGAATGTGGSTSNTGGSGLGSGGAGDGGTGSGATGGGGRTGDGGSPSGGTGGGAMECEATTLGEAGACTNRLIGVALNTAYLNEEPYVQAAREFTYVTAENEMKWSNNEPSQGSFDFGAGDQIAEFAESNGMQIKGHALVWHNQLPGWVQNLGSENAVRSAMLNHIDGVMQHYEGRIHAWDVVNEAWNEEGTALRNSVFYQYLGADYIDEAFMRAREVDPDAKLFYNDFDAEDMGTKSDAQYEMVASMVERGIPIDGVGLQMHIRIPDSEPSIEDLTANLDRLTALGLEVHISEVDVRLCNGETEQQQRDRLHDVIEVCMQEPLCTAITTWGITDKYSWLNDSGAPGCPGGETPYPLLWDDNYQKKPLYDGMLDALLGR